jgi:hypothetical protein
VGSIVAGEMYQSGGDKVVLARRYLVENKGIDAGEVAAISKAKLMPFFEQTVGVDAWGARQLLWDAYQPQSMWTTFTAIGLGAMVLVLIYDRVTAAAAKDPAHGFNVNGRRWVRYALMPIVLGWCIALYQAFSIAVLIQLIMFALLLGASFVAGEDDGGQADADE